MRPFLSDVHEAQRAAFRQFVDEQIVPHADRWDREQALPGILRQRMAEAGYLGAVVPAEWGGAAMDPLILGLLCEEIGRASGSVLSLLTVHTMVCHAIVQWGTPAQRAALLPRLVRGEAFGAFALTEPNAGSDARAIESRAEVDDGKGFVLRGRKTWISMGQVADIVLVFARLDEKPAAFLVDAKKAALKITPLSDMLGFRAAMLAEIDLEACRCPLDSVLGKAGFGLSHVAGSALDLGRYCVAWGSVGIAQACLDACLDYTEKRRAGGAKLRDHQLIQRMLANMVTEVAAARLLCAHVGELKTRGDPFAATHVCTAKYFASRVASSAANDAVQIHGANGCSAAFPVQRYLRDARVTEIIEGSNEIQQMIIAKHAHL